MDDKKLDKALLTLLAYGESLKANAELYIQEVTELRKKLGLVSTRANQKNAVSAADTARVIGRRRKNILRRVNQN